jgi:hypothetical protein
MTNLVQKKATRLAFVITRAVGPEGDDYVLDVIPLYRPTSELAMQREHQAEFIFVVNTENGETRCTKNRYGTTGTVTREAAPMNLAELTDEIKRLLGLGEYNSPSNPCWGDTYYGASLERKYGRPIAELRKIVEV